MGRIRINDPEGMRNRVLDVAAESFQSRGYHATSMHDIMRDAGTTGGALYHHFPTKKDLALAVIRERVAAAVETTWMAPVRAARRTSEGILAVFESIIAELEARGAVRGCPLGNLALELSLADPELRGAVQTIYEAWRTALAESFRADDENDGDPEALATFVIASYSGAMAMAKADQTPSALSLCAEQLARGLAPLQGQASTQEKKRKKRASRVA